MGKNIVLNGKIEQCDDDDKFREVCIGGKNVSREVEDFNNRVVKLKYYISNSIIDPNKVVEQMLSIFYEGKCEAEETYVYNTTWTAGIIGGDEVFEVGGHDIIKELKTHLGKYCHLEIELKPNNP